MNNPFNVETKPKPLPKGSLEKVCVELITKILKIEEIKQGKSN